MGVTTNERNLHGYFNINAACLLHDNDLYPMEEGTASHVLVPKNTFIDVFENTCDMCDFWAHIFCPQTTQELPKKHDEAGSPEDNDLPTDALSQIDYGHIRHCEDCLYQRTTQRTFWKIWVGYPPPLSSYSSRPERKELKLCPHESGYLQ